MGDMSTSELLYADDDNDYDDVLTLMSLVSETITMYQMKIV